MPGISSSPADGGSAAMAADSSTDSVTELIDLERDDPAEEEWATNSPPPQHHDPLQVGIHSV